MARSPPPTSNLSDLERQEMWQRPRWAAAKLDFQELKFKNTSTPGTRVIMIVHLIAVMKVHLAGENLPVMMKY